ncbi:MAG TPA: universal stress protein [Candidatus Cybelea sp.]
MTPAMSTAVPTLAPAGILGAVIVVTSIVLILSWMLHVPKSPVQKMAAETAAELKRMVGSIIVVFSPEINSRHVMALAVKLASGERSELLAVYVIEVPLTLPPDAEMPDEERAALDALGAAETIANTSNVTLHTQIVKVRSTKEAVLGIAKRVKANLIILGSYLEGKYSGARLGGTIQDIAAEAKCDVLIGVEGKHGTLLGEEPS